jgi:dTDP-4-dehydrorhamnose 3,5-epimerase
MDVEALNLPEVLLITPKKFGDSRGFFSEIWNRRKFAESGTSDDFVQDNYSLSALTGTLRGLHCQIGPSTQGKLIRVVRGAIWDVAVDIRHGSPRFGQHAAAVISVENWRQLWVPGGFLHGFCTLAPDTEVIYKVTTEYDAGAERGVIWNDPDLALPWPVQAEAALLSEKDKILPRLKDCAPWFQY